jgi:hypothetical protein
LKQVLYEPNAPIEYAYFPNSGATSMLNLMQDGQTIEAATVGKEGMIGVPLLLGTTQIPLEVIVQIPGDGLRMRQMCSKLKSTGVVHCIPYCYATRKR